MLKLNYKDCEESLYFPQIIRANVSIERRKKTARSLEPILFCWILRSVLQLCVCGLRASEKETQIRKLGLLHFTQ